MLLLFNAEHRPDRPVSLSHWGKQESLSEMSCFHKRPKRTKSEEQAFLEHLKKVAKENGKRLGESSKGANTLEAPSTVLPMLAGACA